MLFAIFISIGSLKLNYPFPARLSANVVTKLQISATVSYKCQHTPDLGGNLTLAKTYPPVSPFEVNEVLTRSG